MMQKTEKWLKPWHMDTHLRVLIFQKSCLYVSVGCKLLSKLLFGVCIDCVHYISDGKFCTLFPTYTPTTAKHSHPLRWKHGQGTGIAWKEHQSGSSKKSAIRSYEIFENNFGVKYKFQKKLTKCGFGYHHFLHEISYYTTLATQILFKNSRDNTGNTGIEFHYIIFT